MSIRGERQPGYGEPYPNNPGFGGIQSNIAGGFPPQAHQPSYPGVPGPVNRNIYPGQVSPPVAQFYSAPTAPPPYNKPPQHPGGGAYNQPPRGPEKNKRGRWIALGATAAAGIVALGVSVGVLTGGGENGNRDAGNPAGGNKTTSQEFELLTGDACENTPYRYGDNGSFQVPEEKESQPVFSDEDILNSFHLYDNSYSGVDVDVHSLTERQQGQIVAVGRDRIQWFKATQANTSTAEGLALDTAPIIAYVEEGPIPQDNEADGLISPDIRFCSP